MGTKTEPGKFDCYARLDDDEPFFVLRAKDPIAPFLVHAWRMLRAGDLKNAQLFIEHADSAFTLSGRALLPTLSAKSRESFTVATEMQNWYDEKMYPESWL